MLQLGLWFHMCQVEGAKWKAQGQSKSDVVLAVLNIYARKYMKTSTYKQISDFFYSEVYK